MIKLQSKSKYLAYFSPVIMILLGILLYSVILPARYNKVISLIDWLFSGTDNIIATLRSADIVLGQAYRILFTKVIVWVWTMGFLFSLFYPYFYLLYYRFRKNTRLFSPVFFPRFCSD